MSNQWPYYYYNPYYQTQALPQDYQYYDHNQQLYPPRQPIQNCDVTQGLVINHAEQYKGMATEPVKVPSMIDKILEKLEKIEEENKQLKEELEKIRPIKIENVNYKIQDLSVQELSGTLLVGLTALSDAENLQELIKDNGPVLFNNVDTSDMENQVENEEEVNNNKNNS